MYRLVTTDGAELGITEEVRYIRRSDNGSFIRTDKENAVGVACNGTPYNLLGHAEIEGADTVIVRETEVGAYMDAAIKRSLSEVEEALCELDGMISGGDR